MKITRVSIASKCKGDGPIIFKASLADDVAIFHALLQFTSRSAMQSGGDVTLVLTALEGREAAREHTFIVVRPGQDADLHPEEYIARVPAFVSTSEVEHSYYLFAVPVEKGETHGS